MVNWLMVTLVIKKDTCRNLEGYAGIGFVKTMSH